MKTTTVYINKDQKMLHILPEIETNTIYDKFIPGIGATTLEIDAKRNSILILPFVPVIEGKRYDEEGKVRTDIIGVCGEVNSEEVANYIESMGGKHKKILCTPEKFDMVIKAIKDQGQNPYEDYFLLLDECETMIKDVDYRQDIKIPLKDFFHFDNKAMISATPIMPRDIRFKRQKFQYVKIRPSKDWTDYRKNLDLIGTTNVVAVLRSYIRDNPEETICVFTNCAKTISKIITDLKLEREAKVFCSYKLVVKRFKVMGIKHTYTSLLKNKNGLAKVNFFTSRFFSAVDMIYPDIKPIVVMVSNIRYSEHSKIDPMTDAIQISGRFRNGIKKVVHISNFNPDIPSRTPKELHSYFDELVTVYNFLNSYKIEPGTNENRINWINQIFEQPPFVKLMADGELDTYLADNLQHQQLVTSYYCNFPKLKAAYLATDYFNVNAKFIPLIIADEDIMKRDAVAGTERRKTIAQMLHAFASVNGPFNLDLSYYQELQEFQFMDELIYTAYFKLGIDFMEDVKYQVKKLRTGLLNQCKFEFKESALVAEAVYINVCQNQTITSQEAKLMLQDVYNKYSKTPIVASGTDIKKYFETTELHNIRRGEREHRGFKLGELKFPISAKLIDPNAHLHTI